MYDQYEEYETIGMKIAFVLMLFSLLMDIFDFPPLFTLQRNVLSQEKQFEVWTTILEKSGNFKFKLKDKIFENVKLRRKMSEELFIALGEYLIRKKMGKWMDEVFLFYKKSISDWGTQIYEIALNNGKINSIESIFSLKSDNEDLKTVPIEIIHSALIYLETCNKCELIFENESTNLDKCGVKFFH